jgi:hypothetical protein
MSHLSLQNRVQLQTSEGLYVVADNRTGSVVLKNGDPAPDGATFELVRHNEDCTVSFRTTHGRYLHGIEAGMFAARATAVGQTERFQEIAQSEGTIALRMIDGTILDADQLEFRPAVFARRNDTSNKSIFDMVNNEDGTVSFLTWFGTYLSASVAGFVAANSMAVEHSERFSVELLKRHQEKGPQKFLLRSSAGKYLQLTENGTAEASSSNNFPCMRFKKVISGDKVGLESCGMRLVVERLPIHTFYMYRSVAEGQDMPFTAVNTGNLAGVMWYLHNEVVVLQPRKFDIDRILRLRVKVTAPERLIARGMHFGVRFAYDSGVCTGAGKKQEWQGEGSCEPFYEKYGRFIGCNRLNFYPFPMASQGFPVHYPGARWYSLPEKAFCGLGDILPTGAEDCMYSVQHAGEISVSELGGIQNYDEFVRSGGHEYTWEKDTGTNNEFWERKFDTERCAQRLEAARQMFADRYPNEPNDTALSEPPCDFDCYKFYDGDPYDAPDECNETLQAQIASTIHPLSAPSWTWDYALSNLPL